MNVPRDIWKEVFSCVIKDIALFGAAAQEGQKRQTRRKEKEDTAEPAYSYIVYSRFLAIVRAMRVLADTTFARVDILPSKTGRIRVGPCPPKNDLVLSRFDSFGPILSFCRSVLI